MRQNKPVGTSQGVICSLQKIASNRWNSKMLYCVIVLKRLPGCRQTFWRPADAMIKGETLLTKIKEKIMHAACMLLVCIIASTAHSPLTEWDSMGPCARLSLFNLFNVASGNTLQLDRWWWASGHIDPRKAGPNVKAKLGFARPWGTGVSIHRSKPLQDERSEICEQPT